MDFFRALFYAFEDRQWVAKLGMMLVLTAAAVLLAPLLVGLVFWALLLGYQERLVHNIRREVRYPLPPWTNYSRLWQRGSRVLAAQVVYALPNLLLLCVAGVMLPGVSQVSFTSAITTIGIACCLLPLLLIYNVISAPLFVIGLGHFNEDPRVNVFFQFSRLFGVLRKHIDATIPFLLATLLSNVLFSVFAATVILLPVALALYVPVQGMLIGEYLVWTLPRPTVPPPPQPRPAQR